jgi:prepilin-type N-terminal cleavage/methylation domain-containing protein
MRSLTKILHRIFSPSGNGLGEKGFTLIELLVVIGILAALAGVVTLAVTQFIGRGESEACETDWHNVQTAAAAYRVEEGSCPANTQALVDAGYILDTPLGSYTIDPNTCKVAKVSCPAAE